MRLLKNDGKSVACAEVAASALGLVSEERLQILHILAERPSYPAELARELAIPVQTVYYHIRLLKKAGLLEFVDYEERNGGVAKKYGCIAQSIAIVLNNRAWRDLPNPRKAAPVVFAPFIKHGFFDALFVVGSPDPHGKYRARASDLGVLELAMLFGQHASFSFPLYSLDTQLKNEDKKRNLILAGGPKVNTLVAEVNHLLPIRFEMGNFELYSTLSKKRYIENVGVVELMQNPFSKKSSILLVGGLNYMGTRAAVLALITKMKEIGKGNSFKATTLATVVEGFDENGDGLIDAVEILE